MTDSVSIYIRPITADDATDEYASWFSDSAVTEFLDTRSFTKADAAEYIERGIRTREYFMFGIFDSSNDAHIGNLKLGPISWPHKFSDLVTVIGRRDYWGKGIATQAIKLGSEMAFRDYGFRKLSGGIAEGNEGSVKAYTRAGWVIEGRLKGHHLINGEPRDRMLVSCFNPAFFPDASGEPKP